jgi:hypothetical protein
MSATRVKGSLCVLSVLIGTTLVISAAPANAALPKNSMMMCSFQQSQSHEDQHLYFEIYYGDYCAVYRVTAALRGASSAAEFGHFELTGPNGWRRTAGKLGGCDDGESRFNDGDGVDCTLPHQHGSLSGSWCATFWRHNGDGSLEPIAGPTCVIAGH